MKEFAKFSRANGFDKTLFVQDDIDSAPKINLFDKMMMTGFNTAMSNAFKSIGKSSD